MNLKKLSILVLYFLLFHQIPGLSQDNRTTETRIADLLVQFPAEDEEDLINLMHQMITLKGEGWERILDLVVPPGTGDDTGARFAIESLSRYLGEPGQEDEKEHWERAILNGVERSDDTDVRRFLISQLNYFGGEQTVKGLSVYLADDELFDPVIRAMRYADPGAAAAVFAVQLKQVRGEARIALINALGEIGNARDASAIEGLAGSEEPELQRSVLKSLALLGYPGSRRTLMKAAKSVAYLPESTNATGSLLSYAESLAEKGETRKALKICRIIQKKCTGPDQLHFRIRALVVAAGSVQIEQSVPMLLDAMQDEMKPYRMAAIEYAAAHNTPVEPWMEALRSADDGEVQAEILYLFELLADDETSEIVSDFLQHKDGDVRQQAARSLSRIRGSNAVGNLVLFALEYQEEADLNTARELLLQTIRQDQVPFLVSNLDGAGDEAKAVLLEVIASRGGELYFPVLFEQIGTPPVVRKAALENLYRVAPGSRLPLLLEMLKALNQEEELQHVEDAIVAAVQKMEDRKAAIRTILDFATGEGMIRKSIGVAAALGGEEATEFVLSAYRNGDETTREKALNALVRTTDASALSALYQICTGNHPEADKQAAFRSYLRGVGRSEIPDDQQLLLLRKIEPYAAGNEEKQQLIRTMGRVKTFLSMITIGKYLEEELLQSEAANALANVIMPGDGPDNGLSGRIAREYLIRSRDLVSGEEREYLKAEIDDYLAAMPGEAGFVSIFNGMDLSGWQGLAAEPLQKQKLTPAELMKLQEEANEKLKENWSVEEGCIVFNGRGNNLCTIKQYGDFEMIVDWRITKKGDSGIYLRGSPQVQIWDTSRVEVGAQVGSGGLYNNLEYESKPLLVADNPVGEWNTFRITMTGERVTVYLNGLLVTDSVVMENYWDRSIPIFPTGSIELQAHGTDLAFRDLYIREIEPAGYRLSEEEQSEGFNLLFNGHDLSGWTGANHSYDVENGTIVIRPTEGGGNLYTEKEYDDFVLRFEFRLTPGANNGLGIRAPLEGDAAYAGYELQILDNTAPEYASLAPYQYHGSVYGLIPAKRGFQKPVGEWNSQEVTAQGDEIRVVLNGTTILEGNLKDATRDGTADGIEHPGLNRTGGHIGFLGHGSLVWFRNIRIREL